MTRRGAPRVEPSPLRIAEATVDDDAAIAAIAAIRTAAARDLTARHGRGHWSYETHERGARSELRHARSWLAWRDAAPLGVFTLTARKPWAIDPSYFTPAERALYLIGMAVHPDAQRQGIGRACLGEAARIAWAWPADALRLDSYDAPAGAGAFYARCGWREAGRAVYRGNGLRYFELVPERRQ